MNLNEVKKHVIFQMIIYVLIGVCFVLSLIAILSTPVKASELKSTNITTGVANTTNCGSKSNGSYCYGQFATSSITWSKGSFNTSYGYSVSDLAFDLNSTFPQYSGVPATLEIHSGSNSFKNTTYSCSWAGNNQPSSCSVVRVSASQININFRMPVGGGTPSALYIEAGDSINISTYLSNININKIVILQTVDDPNAGVIQNANENTANIINNQNENTQQITNSLTSMMNLDKLVSQDTINTQRANLQNMCENSYDVSLFRGYTLTANGSLTSSANTLFSDFTEITNSTLCIQNSAESSANLGGTYYVITYRSDKSYLGAYDSFNRCINLPSAAKYFRVATKYPGILITKGGKCETAEDQINSYLRDDSNPTIDQNGIDNVLGSVEVSDPLSYLLTLPISLLQKLNTVLSANSCSRVSFGSLYNTELYLPCIDFGSILGSNLWGTIDLIVGVGLLAIILKRFYDSISNILTMGKEKEVRDKLDLPTPMQFLASILGGGRD